MDIIIPATFKDSDTPFLDMMNRPDDAKRIHTAFMNTLAGSFREDQRRQGKAFVARILTEAEKKRRANIVARWFRRLRGDLGFGLIKTLDELPKALRAELDGIPYTPPAANRLWAPGGDQC